MFKKPLDLNSPNKKNWLSRRLTPSHASIVNKYLKLQKDGHTRLYHILTATSQERNDKQLAKLVTEIQGLDSLSQQKLKEAISHELFSQKPVDYLAPLTHTIQTIKQNPKFAAFLFGYAVPLTKDGNYDLRVAFQIILLLQQHPQSDLHFLLELWHTYCPELFAKLQKPGFLTHYDPLSSKEDLLQTINLTKQQYLEQCLNNFETALKNQDFSDISLDPIKRLLTQLEDQLETMSAFDLASNLTLSKVIHGDIALPCIVFSPTKRSLFSSAKHSPIWLLNPQLPFQYLDTSKTPATLVTGTVLHGLLHSYKEQLLSSNKSSKSHEKVILTINTLIDKGYLTIKIDNTPVINTYNSQGETVLHMLVTLYAEYEIQHANDLRAGKTLTFLSTLLQRFLTSGADIQLATKASTAHQKAKTPLEIALSYSKIINPDKPTRLLTELSSDPTNLAKLRDYQKEYSLSDELIKAIIPKKAISSDAQMEALEKIKGSLKNPDLWLLYRSVLSHTPKEPFQDDPFLNHFYRQLSEIKKANQLDEKTWKEALTSEAGFFDFLKNYPNIQHFFIKKFSYPPFLSPLLLYTYHACFSLQKSILKPFFSGSKEDSTIILGLLRTALLPESSIPQELSEDFHTLVTLLKAAVPNGIKTQWESTLNQAIFSQNPLLAFEFLLNYPQFATQIVLYLTELPYWAAAKSDLNIQEFCKEALLLPSRSMKEALTSLTNKIAEPVIKKEHFSDLVLPDSNILSLLDLNDPYTVFAVLTENYQDQLLIKTFLPFLETTEIELDPILGFDATAPSIKPGIESFFAQLCNTLNYSNFDAILTNNSRKKLENSLIKLLQTDHSFRSILPEAWKARPLREIILGAFLQTFSAEDLRLMGLPLVLKSSKLPLSQKEYDALFSSFKVAIEKEDLDKLKLILDLREPFFNSSNSLLKVKKDSLSSKVTDLLLENTIASLFEKSPLLLRKLPINQQSPKLYLLKLRDESAQKIQRLPNPFKQSIKLPAFNKTSLEEEIQENEIFLKYVTQLEGEYSNSQNFGTLIYAAWNGFIAPTAPGKPTLSQKLEPYKEPKTYSVTQFIDNILSKFSGKELETLSLSLKAFLQEFDSFTEIEKEKLLTLFKESIKQNDFEKIKLILNFKESAYSSQKVSTLYALLNEWLTSKEFIALFKENPKLLVGLPVNKDTPTLYFLKLLEEAKILPEPFNIMATKLLFLYKESFNLPSNLPEPVRTLLTLINETSKAKQTAIGALFYQHFPDYSPIKLESFLKTHSALQTLLFTCFAQLDEKISITNLEEINDEKLENFTPAINRIMQILHGLNKDGQEKLRQEILLSPSEHSLKLFSAAHAEAPLAYSSAYLNLMIELINFSEENSLLPLIETRNRKYLKSFLENNLTIQGLLLQCAELINDKSSMIPTSAAIDDTLSDNSTLVIKPIVQLLQESLDKEGQQKLYQAMRRFSQSSDLLETFLTEYPEVSSKLIITITARQFNQPSLFSEVSLNILPEQIKAIASQGWSEHLIKKKRTFDKILLNKLDQMKLEEEEEEKPKHYELSRLEPKNPKHITDIVAHQENYISLEKEILEFRLQELFSKKSYSTSQLEACYKEYIKNVTRFYEALKCQPTQLSFSYTLKKNNLSLLEENIARICKEEFQSFQDKFFIFKHHHTTLFDSLLSQVKEAASLKKNPQALSTIHKELSYLLKLNISFYQEMAKLFKESATLTSHVASLTKSFGEGEALLNNLLTAFDTLNLQKIIPGQQIIYFKGILETVDLFHHFVHDTEAYCTQFHNTLPPVPFEHLDKSLKELTDKLVEELTKDDKPIFPSLVDAIIKAKTDVKLLGYPTPPAITKPDLFSGNVPHEVFFNEKHLQEHSQYIITSALRASQEDYHLWQSLYQDLRSLYPSEDLAEVLEEAIDQYNKDMLSYNKKDNPPSYIGIGVRATYIVDELTQAAFFLITEVFENSPAAKAQLTPGDKIFAAAQEANHFINISLPNESESGKEAARRNAQLIRGGLKDACALKIQREGTFYNITISNRATINTQYQSVYHPLLEEKQKIASIARKEMRKHTEDKIIEMFLEDQETKSQLTPVAQQIITKLVKENDLKPQTEVEHTIKTYAEQIIQEHKPIKGATLRETIASIPKQSFVERVNKEFKADHDKPAGARTVIPNNISNKNDIALI